MPPTSFARAASGRRRRRRAPTEDVGRRGRGEHPHRVRAGAGAAAVAVVALPQPGRVADRVQQRSTTTRTGCRRSPRPRPGSDAGRTAAASALVRVDGTFHRSGDGQAAAHQPGRGARRSSPRSAAGSTPSPDVVAVDRRRHLQRASSAPTSSRCCATPATTGWSRRSTAPTARACSSRTWRTCRATSATSILFSTAFSVNDKGVLPLNFGPLNRAGGERRLNVAVTRARRQVVVFSSFDPAQLRAEETHVGRHQAPARLPRPRRAGHRGAGRRRVGAAPVVDRHRDEVAARAARAAGLVVRTDVGLSDFRVDLTLARAGRPGATAGGRAARRPGLGARGARSATATGCRSRCCRGCCGWPAVERVWLPAWLRDPDAVVAELVARVEAVRSGQDTGDLPDVHVEGLPMVKQAPVPEHRPTRSPSPGCRARSRSSPGRRRQVRSRHTLDSLPSPTAARRVWDVATQVIDTEGPVLESRLVKLVASAFDLTRVAAARAEAIRACLPTDVRDENGFYWPPSRPRGAWTGFRQRVRRRAASARRGQPRGDRQRHGRPVPGGDGHVARGAGARDRRGVRRQAGHAGDPDAGGAGADRGGRPPAGSPTTAGSCTRPDGRRWPSVRRA